MSAIGGVLYFNNNPVKKCLLEKMSRKVSHRGNDKTQIWVDSNIGFHNNLLKTTNGNLITQDDTKFYTRFKITADCRIDNRDYLLNNLNLRKNKKFYTDCDLILESYKNWGKKCIHHLLGDFSFAIWDQKKKNYSVQGTILD